MKSLAIVRAADILKLNSKLSDLNRAGLDFESKPKEINPASIEKILPVNTSGENYEVCALICLNHEPEFLQEKLKISPLDSDVIVIDDSHKYFEYFVKLIPVLPDLANSRIFKEINKQTGDLKEKSSKVYLGVFVNRKVQVQTTSDSIHTGILKHADSIGVFFEPSDDSDPIFITWHDIKKIIIPKEGKK